MSIFKLPKQLKPIPPDVHIDTVGEFEIFRKGDLYIVEQPIHALKTSTRSAFRTLLDAYIYSKNWQGIPYEPITFTAYEERRKMYTIVLRDIMGETYFQERTDTNDIDRHMKEKYDADLYIDGVYIPNAPQNSQERLFVSIDMTE